MKSERRKLGKALLFAVLFATLAFVSVSVGCASAATHYVNPGESIQTAVDAANPNDTIIVRDGTYNENVDVNVTHLTVQSENGSASTIINASDSNDHVFNVSEDYVNITGFTVGGAKNAGYPCYSSGLYLESVENCNIVNNTASNNHNGIYLGSSSNNTLTNNNAYNNTYNGIYLSSSSNNTITNNTVSNNSDYGIYVGFSTNNTLTNNTITNNDKGIRLAYSSNNTLMKNTMSGSTYNFEVYGTSLPHHYIHEIDTSNLVDEKPIYYWINEKDKAVPSNAGFVGVVNSTNISVRYLTLTNNYKGIFFVYTNDSRIENINVSNSYFGIWLSTSSNNTITSNTITNNLDGICLEYSSNNTLTKNIAFNNTCGGILLHASSNNTLMNNIVSNNSDYGIYPYSSSGGPSCNNIITNNTITNNDDGICYNNCCSNNIYLNNFIHNNHNARPVSPDSTSIWSSLEKITYTYNGKTYTNYLGNYWDDYTFEENDTNGDGIGDTPYSINSNTDNYPLMQPWENYFAPTENIFDTEPSKNPYPSIMGTHNGTITPSYNVTVSRLYTYACVGTGGHTKSIELCDENDTLIANGSWNGYVGDWHNITLHNLTGGTPYVTLLENHEYNYTIITGSYPQIHHNASLLTKNGWINCTSFVDANGKGYDDWIPAIRLE